LNKIIAFRDISLLKEYASRNSYNLGDAQVEPFGDDDPLRIVLLGPPGSGKGTCAKIIEELYNIPVITTGEMLRTSVSKETQIGKIAKSYMDRGELVPDNIVNTIVEERLLEPDAVDGFVLDGYPRSISQAKALDKILDKIDKKLDHVLYVKLEDAVIISRTSNRRSCPTCGAIFNRLNKPPKISNVCDICGSILVQRDDDKEEVIKHRLEVYKEKTKPLIDYYRKKGKVKEIRGDIDLKLLPESLKNVLKA